MTHTQEIIRDLELDLATLGRNLKVKGFSRDIIHGEMQAITRKIAKLQASINDL